MASPFRLTRMGMLTNPDALVHTGTKYAGNFRDNTQLRTLSDGTVWAHFTGGSVINGTNGTVVYDDRSKTP